MILITICLMYGIRLIIASLFKPWLDINPIPSAILLPRLPQQSQCFILKQDWPFLTLYVCTQVAWAGLHRWPGLETAWPLWRSGCPRRCHTLWTCSSPTPPCIWSGATEKWLWIRMIIITGYNINHFIYEPFEFYLSRKKKQSDIHARTSVLSLLF